MKKKIITSFVFCFLGAASITSVAQAYKNFDLSTYFTPDIVRSQLDLSGVSAGSFNNVVDGGKGNNVNGNLNSWFNNTKNTRHLIRFIDARLSLAGSKSNTSNVPHEKHYGSFDNSADLGIYYKLFNSTNKFLSFGGIVNYKYNSDFSDETNDGNSTSEIKHHRNNAGLVAYVGAGFGRIEDVTDAQQAVYIVEALAKNNVLDRDLTTHDIFNLSQEISRIKNKRFLDARIRLISEVTHIDSFFVTNKLISKQNAKYFANLYDCWLYGDRFERKSGHSFEIRLTPEVFQYNTYSKEYFGVDNNNNLEHKSKYSTTNIGLLFNFQYEKPVNQIWQHSIETSILGKWMNPIDTFEDLTSKSTEDSERDDQLGNLRASYKLGLYPNSRTNVYAQLEHNIDYYNNNDVDYKTLINTTRLKLGTYYYFSPQLSLSANCELSRQRYKQDHLEFSDSQKVFRGNFSIGLTYSFF